MAGGACRAQSGHPQGAALWHLAAESGSAKRETAQTPGTRPLSVVRGRLGATTFASRWRPCVACLTRGQACFLLRDGEALVRLLAGALQRRVAGGPDIARALPG